MIPRIYKLQFAGSIFCKANNRSSYQRRSNFTRGRYKQVLENTDAVRFHWGFSCIELFLILPTKLNCNDRKERSFLPDTCPLPQAGEHAHRFLANEGY
jgi:hypothetical protein